MITKLGLYKVIFVCQILIAMFLFSMNRLKLKKNGLIRILIAVPICFLVALFFPLFKSFSYSWWYSSLMFFALFCACFLSMLFIFEEPGQKIFFISIAAYTTQHLSYQIYSLIVNLIDVEGLTSSSQYTSNPITYKTLHVSLILFSIMLVIYVIMYGVINEFFIDKIYTKNAKVSNISIVIISALILAIDIIFNSVVVYSSFDNIIISLIICLYNIVCCFMVLLLQFYVMSLKQSQTDLLVTSQLLYNSENQYKQNKENIELINIKCHDLKHQISRFNQKGNLSKEEVEELENMVDIYDAKVKTGNDVLDLIITEKSLLCQKNNIKLKCYADCSKLNFISETDLYNLFGNALDNAIEAVCKINNQDKRGINLIVKNAMSFVSITIENYFDGKIKLDKQGIPKTTKNNEQYHGFGMKSIKLIVNKYHGDLKIVLDDDVFSLGILFPIN